MKYTNKTNEAASQKIKRSDLKVGDEVLTYGWHDNVNLEFRRGKIIKMGEYGNILIEFNESFDKNLHAGHDNIGEAKHCFYIPIPIIRSIDPAEFDKIVKKEQIYDDDAEWWFANRGKKTGE